MGKGQSLQQMLLLKLYIHVQKNKIGPLPYSIQKKINSKWVKDLNVTFENVKPLEENIRKKLLDISLGINFLETAPKVHATETKIKVWDYIKLKSYCIAKEIIN